MQPTRGIATSCQSDCIICFEWGMGGRKEMEQLWLGGGVNQLEDVINFVITYQYFLKLDLFACDFNWRQLVQSVISTNKHTGHFMRGASKTVDQMWAGKEQQTAMGPEPHVQTHKSCPDLLLPMFSLLLGKKWDSTWALAEQYASSFKRSGDIIYIYHVNKVSYQTLDSGQTAWIIEWSAIILPQNNVLSGKDNVIYCVTFHQQGTIPVYVNGKQYVSIILTNISNFELKNY